MRARTKAINGLLTILVSSWTLGIGQASAQDLVYLKGLRVRITEQAPLGPRPSGRPRWIGEVSLVSADTLALLLPDRTVRRVPMDRVERLEVSTGWRSRNGRGAWIGAVAGAVGGITTALLACRDDACNPSGGDLTGLAVGVLGVGGAVIGTALGVAVGSAIHYENWRQIGIGVLPAMQPGRMGTAGRLGFRVTIPALSW